MPSRRMIRFFPFELRLDVPNPSNDSRRWFLVNDRESDVYMACDETFDPKSSDTDVLIKIGAIIEYTGRERQIFGRRFASIRALDVLTGEKGGCTLDLTERVLREFRRDRQVKGYVHPWRIGARNRSRPEERILVARSFRD